MYISELVCGIIIGAVAQLIVLASIIVLINSSRRKGDNDGDSNNK